MDALLHFGQFCIFDFVNRECVRAVKLILNAGCDVNVVTPRVGTPSSYSGNFQIV